VRARLPKTFPPWDILTKHPELSMETISRFPVDAHHIVAEIRVRGEKSRDWSDELLTASQVVSVHRLDRIGRPDVYRVKWEAPRYYVSLLEKYDLVGSIPIVLSMNHAEVKLALSRTRLQKLVRELRRRNFEPEVLEVRRLRGRIVRSTLTSKQRERFQIAIESGYFDVPRRVSLDELARRFSIQKSALSESLAHARRKVLVAAGNVMMGENEEARVALFGAA
jgi:HTH DNA binding domain